jgi:hypothetical protein
MQLCFCIASVHKQYLNSALVDRYFLDEFKQTSVFLNYTFILSTLKECKGPYTMALTLRRCQNVNVNVRSRNSKLHVFHCGPFTMTL